MKPTKYYLMSGFRNTKQTGLNSVSKCVLCLLLVLFFQNQLRAQVGAGFKISSFYVSTGFGFGHGGSPTGFGVNVILDNTWGLSVNTRTANIPVRRLPEEYRTGSEFYVPGAEKGELEYYPVNRLEMTNIMLMKEFILKDPRIRFGIEAGISSLEYNEAYFTMRPNPGIGFDDFDVHYKYFKGTGFASRLKFELPHWRTLGCELALMSNVNKYNSYVGVELHLTFGLLRESFNEN